MNIAYAQLLAQIKQGRPQFDVIDTSMADVIRFKDAGRPEALDYDRLKSIKNAGIAEQPDDRPRHRQELLGQRHGVPHGCLRRQEARELGGLLGHQGVQGQPRPPGPDADLPELEFALLADGVPLDKLYPLDVDRAFKSLDNIRGSVKKYWDTGALPGVLLGRQEVVATSVWHGRLDALIKGGSPMAYQWNGARRQSNGFCIPKGDREPRRRLPAHRLRTASRHPGRLRRDLPMAPVVPAAYKKLSPAAAGNLASSPEHLRSGFDLDVEWWIKNEAAVSKRWQEWVNA